MSDNPGNDMVYCDYSRRITIVVEISGGIVKHIPLRPNEGFSIQADQAVYFHRVYRPLLDYPIDRAIGVYLNYLRFCRAQHKVLEYIKRIIPTINIEEYIMSEEQAKAAETTAAKVKEQKPKRESAARMFQELIMDGNLTDDAIFAAVKEKFNLDDSKRGYVGWYRNYLKKQGKNPPAAIQPPKPVEAAPAPAPAGTATPAAEPVHPSDAEPKSNKKSKK